MKIRLDQNLSPRVASAIRAALPNRSGFEVSYVGDVHPPGTSDPDWLRQFAEEGGTAIITGDFNMIRNWPDLVAYTETGLVSFFPPSGFEKLDRFGKIAFILRWMPSIIEKIKLSQPGDRWRLPLKWEPHHTKMIPLRDPRVKGRTVEEKPQSEGAQILRLGHRKKAE